jgi:hypothetical protein
MVSRVEHLVLQPSLLEQTADDLGLLDADRTDKNGLAALVALLDLVEDRPVLLHLGLVDDVVVVGTNDRLVGRHDPNVEVVDLLELLFLSDRSTGHARQLLVHPEVVLVGDGGIGLALRLDVELLLCLDGLVEPIRPTPPGHQSTGVLIDDHDLAVLDDIVSVSLEERVGLERLVDVVEDLHVVGIVEVVDAQLQLDLIHAAVGEVHAAALLVNHVVDLSLKPRNDAVDDSVLFDILAGWP